MITVEDSRKMCAIIAPFYDNRLFTWPWNVVISGNMFALSLSLFKAHTNLQGQYNEEKNYVINPYYPLFFVTPNH